jgi:hypothetical protein
VTPGQRRQRSLVALAIASVAFVAVTAAQGSSTISVALPAIDRWIEGAVAILFEEMIRRGFKKVDKIGLKCDRVHEQVERVDVALRGYDGEGGALSDIRVLQNDVAELQRAPVAPPPGFSVAPRAAQRSGT